MAKASANLFPYVHLVPAAAPASPAAGSQRLYLDSGNSNKLTRRDSAGAVTVVEGGGGGTSGGVLASTVYDPGTIASYAIASTTVTDVDATNLVVTFTAPASGTVIVSLSALCTSPGGAGNYINWSLRDGTTTLKTRFIAGLSSNDNIGGSAMFKITGLTSGTSYTYKWAHSRTGAGTGTTHAGGIAGPAVMKVESA